eukprot:Seg3589.3 transcript_id=Seg3589.3/GoldUCD/mRNA.D3Y31 product="hypothetical protein" protein_id=Seg3589.3/GoldUCD/D3Y31
MFSDALGQEGQEVVNFKTLSNTDDFPDNNASHFFNQPYEGVEFDRRYPWSMRCLSASVPFDVDTHLERDVWLKRVQIPANEKYAQFFDSCLSPENYNKFISQCERVTLPAEIVKHDCLGRNASQTLPKSVIDFFNCAFDNKVFIPDNQTPPQVKRTFWPAFPILKINNNLNNTTEVDDLFELTIHRTSGGNSRVDFEKNFNESGYMEILRVSRTLEIFLGLNVLDNWATSDTFKETFPFFERELPGLNMRAFDKSVFFNLDAYTEKMRVLANLPNLKRCGFWGCLLDYYNIPFIIMKIKQSYNDNDTFQGGNLAESTYSHKTDSALEFDNKESNRHEQYSDYFITTILPSGENARNLFYNGAYPYNDVGIPPISLNPNMIDLSRGISWSCSKYVRHQLGCKFVMEADFIAENIYQGVKASTMLCDNIPLDITKQYPFAKYIISQRFPVSGLLNIHNTTTLSFKTKRILRSHIQKKKHVNKIKSRRLVKRQPTLKSYRYPIVVTVQATVDN